MNLFFAQGYNAARDRLFEFEIFRRRATAPCRKYWAPRRSIATSARRQFMYRGDLDKELAVYHPHGAPSSILRQGVNAISTRPTRTLLRCRRNSDAGPQAAHWTVNTILSRANSVSLGQPNAELQMALALHALGPDKIKDLVHFQPANPDLRIDPAVDVSIMNAAILDTYNAGHPR